MNPQSEHHGFWSPTPFFTPELKEQGQYRMSGMAGLMPSWKDPIQFPQQKQRQAHMLLMSQQQNLRITGGAGAVGSPLDMDMPISPTSPIRMASPRKSGKADRRAEHNAIERARRESLNVKFQQLAHALPNLQDDRRPSKSRIVEKALEWVRQTFHREQQYRHEIQQLRLENERLRALLSNKTMKGSFTEIEVTRMQSDTNMLSFNNWSSLSNEYLFDPSVRPDDFPFSEQHDDDDNSSNEGDYESEHNVSFFDASQLDPLSFSKVAMMHRDMKSAIIPNDINVTCGFRNQ